MPIDGKGQKSSGTPLPHSQGVPIQHQDPPRVPTTVFSGPNTRQPAVPEWTRAAWIAAKDSCAPGHQFSLYFAIWNDQWEMVKTLNHESGKVLALKECLSFASVEPLASAIRERQTAVTCALPKDSFLVIDAESTSPFTTGLGIEHPVENGFAFLTPYGLPYLAGSGVKGVLRRAAEDTDSLSDPERELLFGTDNQPAEDQQKVIDENHTRGILTFWDVFPLPPKAATGANPAAKLSIEVMTAHHSGYLQKGGPPHDSEQPNPIPFLAIPPHAAFRFVVTCQLHRLTPGALSRPWEETVKSLFADAFAWLGFGAKTAVGYGAMKQLSQAEAQRAHQEAAKAAAKCQWVDDTLRAMPTSVVMPLYTTVLAGKWKEIQDPVLKAAALTDIKARWGAAWDEGLTSGRKKAKAIYEENA